MSNPNSTWFQMNTQERKEAIRQGRLKQHSFSKIAVDLLGSKENKSTIWSWAQRNMDSLDIYPKMRKLPKEPYSMTDVEQWVMYDTISSLFPRLDALAEHIIVEVNNILTDQHRNFTITAGFLDDLEKRVIEAISRNTALVSSRVSRVLPTAAPSPISPTPIGRGITVSPPPPPPPSDPNLPVQDRVPAGPMTELRTDFEEMDMEEITALPQDFLEVLTPVDRNRLQSRVKELKMLEKMSPKERETFLQKKREEKERADAAEGLGGSLTAMLDDSDSLFARMRHAADDSQVSGTGTFGKFTTEYFYFYCLACGKTNRSEEEKISSCGYCNAEPYQLVLDENKSDYTYWECLSAKKREPVDLNYSRGKEIVVKSRWKTPVGEPLDQKNCEPENIRDITSAVLIKTDPDKQFSHYLALFRMYSQLNLQGDLRSYLEELSDEIQKLPDISTKENASSQAIIILDKLTFLLEWLESREGIKTVSDSKGVQIQVENLKEDIKLLQDPEAPQEIRKTSEVGQIAGRIDQILNRFMTIFAQLESEFLSVSRWKCSECESVFEIKDRKNIPDRCSSCGKIITKLERLD